MRDRQCACERWKRERRGFVPMDVFNAQEGRSCCSCGFSNVFESGCEAEEAEDIQSCDCCCN